MDDEIKQLKGYQQMVELNLFMYKAEVGDEKEFTPVEDGFEDKVFKTVRVK